MIFTYYSLLAKKFCCLRLVGCLQCMMCLIWHLWRWGSEIGFVWEINFGMCGHRVANNIALLEMRFWLLCVMLKVSLHSCSLIELLKSFSNIYLHDLIIWSHSKIWDSNNCLMTVHIYWAVTPCHLVNNYHCYKGACCLHLQGLSTQQAPLKHQ